MDRFHANEYTKWERKQLRAAARALEALANGIVTRDADRLARYPVNGTVNGKHSWDFAAAVLRKKTKV